MGLWRAYWKHCHKWWGIDLRCWAISWESSLQMTQTHFSSLFHFFVWVRLCLQYICLCQALLALHYSTQYSQYSNLSDKSLSQAVDQIPLEWMLLFSLMHWWRSQRGTCKMKLSVRLLPLGPYVVKKCYLMLPGSLFFRPALSVILLYKQTQREGKWQRGKQLW